MSRLVTRRALGAGALTLALALPAASAAFADVPEGTEVTVFNVNDYHGRLSNAADLACTLVTEREQVGNDNHVFLSAGDNIGATEFASYLADDVPTIEVLNALGLAASADGNHEYDQGIDDLTGRVADIADFEYLSANVFHADGSRAATPYTVVDAGDVRVGVIGANTADTPALVSPSGIEGLEFTDPVSAVNDAVEELEASDLEYDLLVVEYHEGSASDAAPGENPGGGELFERIVSETSPEVDAIFNGHTHRSYNFEAAVPGTDRTRPIMQTGSYGENLGAVTLAQGADGSWEVTADGNRLIATENADIAACDAAADPAYVQARDIAAQAIADGEVAAAEPVGTITDDISTAFAPANASYIDGTWTKNDGYTGRGDDRASSSALSDELADSMRWATQRDSFSGSRADIGVMNPGGVRANLDYAASGDEGDGVVTFGEANDVVPFVNTLETVDLTGAQVKTMLEQQWQRDRAGNVPSRSYLQLGLSDNVTYTFDDSRDEGDRITSVMVDGEPLQADATYTIVSANFLTSGGDNFHVLADGTNRADTGLIDRDAWIDYLEANQDLDPTYAQRGVEVADQGIDSGTWNVQVSGVESRSLGAPQIETVEVTVGDETIEAPYENADGTWQATLAITCSED
ncbi:MAG: 5'-nucleotidase C-terminal domain-containing protein, partial [Brachybacterium sp.]|nr:5'-nucleotidase C-terminal domain-containing protein [Brachybacterium sp.]